MQVGPATETDIDFLSMLSREVSRMHADAGPCVFKQATPEACGEGLFRRQLADADSFILVATNEGALVRFARGTIVRAPETVFVTPGSGRTASTTLRVWGIKATALDAP